MIVVRPSAMPQRLECGDGRGGQPDVLLEFPQVLVEMTLHAELLEEPALEIVEHAGIHVAHVDQQDLGRAADARVLIDEGASPVDDADVVETLDPAEGGAVAGVDEAVDGGVQDLAALAEPVLDRAFGREQRTDQDRAVNGFQVRGTGEEALQNGPDAADLARRLMGDVNDDVFVGHSESLRVGPQREFALGAQLRQSRPESGAPSKTYETKDSEPIGGDTNGQILRGTEKIMVGGTKRRDDFRTPAGEPRGQDQLMRVLRFRIKRKSNCWDTSANSGSGG